MTAKTPRPFLPAAGKDVFLPLYDPFTRLFGFDGARAALVAQANLQPHQRVLDVGCGTGTLAVLIKQRHPTIDVVGLDPDPKALARARTKARRTEVAVQFDQGFSDALGYGDGAFDHVFSSLMFHHLDAAAKEGTLREIHRVLRPGGQLHLLDLGDAASSGHGGLTRLVHSHQQMKENDESRVLALMKAVGFAAPAVVNHRGTLFGRLAYYQAQK